MSHRHWDAGVEYFRQTPGLQHLTYMGRIHPTGQPFAVPDDRSNPHTICLGGVGTEARWRVMFGYALQRLLQGNSLVVVSTHPSRAATVALDREAAGEGVPCRVVNTTTGLLSTAMSLTDQPYTRDLSPYAWAELLVRGLNLDDDLNEGGAYRDLFAAVRILFPEARTFDDILRRLEDPKIYERMVDDHVWRLTGRGRSLVRRFATATAFNVTDPTPAVAAWAIDFRQPFTQRQVIVINADPHELPGLGLSLTGLVLQHLSLAQRFVTVRHKVTLVFDDIHAFLAVRNLTTILKGLNNVELVMIHHDMGRIQQPEIWTAMQESTGLQILLSPQSHALKRHVQDGAGEKVYHSASWTQPARGGRYRPNLRHATPHPLFGLPEVKLSERVGPAWSMDEIAALSATEGLAWMRLARDAPHAQYGGRWLPVCCFFPHTKEEFHAMENCPWPGDPAGMVRVERESPYELRHREKPPNPRRPR